jgi:short-subunit dehydrogenase
LASTGPGAASPAGRSDADRDGRALVTGASSGIGAAFARALRSRGHRLVLVARRADRLRRLAEELGGEVEAACVPLDLRAPDAAEALERSLRERGLRVDLLVNDAGVGDTGRFDNCSPARALEIVDVNVRAVVALTRAFLPGMVQRRAGAVVNVVSMSAFQPVPFLATYAASKAFVLSFTEAVADEVRGSGVRVQALCPGLVPTEFQAVAGTDRVPFNRVPSLDAAAVVRASLDALDGGPVRVFPAWRDRATVGLQRIAPRRLVRRIARELFRPQPDPDARSNR